MPSASTNGCSKWGDGVVSDTLRESDTVRGSTVMQSWCLAPAGCLTPRGGALEPGSALMSWVWCLTPFGSQTPGTEAGRLKVSVSGTYGLSAVRAVGFVRGYENAFRAGVARPRSEEHTSELQSREKLVC